MLEKVTVVIVEDDEGHANLIRKNLKRAGLSNKIIHLDDGDKALNFFLRKGKGPYREENEAYVILLDILMPKKNGDEVLMELKKDEVLRRIPVIMITTSKDPELISACYDIGCSGYIVKPIVAEQFVEAINQLGSYLKNIEVAEVDESFACSTAEQGQKRGRSK